MEMVFVEINSNHVSKTILRRTLTHEHSEESVVYSLGTGFLVEPLAVCTMY